MRGIGGGSKGEKHCPEAGSKQKGSGVTLVFQHQQNQQNLNLSAPANSVLCSDCAPQLLCVPLNSLHQRTVTNHGLRGEMEGGQGKNEESEDHHRHQIGRAHV